MMKQNVPNIVLGFTALLLTGMFGGAIYQAEPPIFWIIFWSYTVIGLWYGVLAFVRRQAAEQKDIDDARKSLDEHLASEGRRKTPSLLECRWCDNEADCDAPCPKHGMVCECCPVCRLECAAKAIEAEEEE